MKILLGELDLMIDTAIRVDRQFSIFRKIKNFDEMTPYMPPLYILKHVYVPVRILWIGGDYYLVYNEEAVWGGHIDPDGLARTIERDITTLPDLINFNIATRIGDRAKLTEIMSETDTMSDVLAQQKLGEQYYEQNHGDKPLH